MAVPDVPGAVSEGAIRGISVFRETYSARMEVVNGEQENERRQGSARRWGRRVAPKAGRAAGKLAWKAGKSEAKLIRRAMSAQQSRKSRYFKYGIFALVGLAIGAAIARSKKRYLG